MAKEAYWKRINGHSGYFVNRNGEVLSCKGRKPRLLKQFRARGGYLRVELRNDSGHRAQKYVSDIVAEAFIDNPEKFHHVTHLDGNRANNEVSNLKWCSIGECVSRGLIKKGVVRKGVYNKGKRVKQFTLEGKFLAEYQSLSHAAAEAGLSMTAIQFCCCGRTKTAKGFVWKYAET